MDNAKAKGLVVLRTPMGFMVAATRDGKPMAPDQYEALSEEEQKEIDEKISVTQKDLEAVLKEIPKQEKERRRALEELNAEVANRAVERRGLVAETDEHQAVDLAIGNGPERIPGFLEAFGHAARGD